MSSQWKCKFQRFCILFFRFNQIVVEKKILRILHEIRIFSRINWKRFRSIFIRFEEESVDEERYKSKVCSLFSFSRTIYVRFVYLLSEQLSLLLCLSFSLFFMPSPNRRLYFLHFSLKKRFTIHAYFNHVYWIKWALLFFWHIVYRFYFFTKKCLQMIFWHIKTRLLQSSETTIKVGAYYTRRKGSNYLQRTRTTFVNFAHLHGGSCDQNTLTLLKQSVFVVI